MRHDYNPKVPNPPTQSYVSIVEHHYPNRVYRRAGNRARRLQAAEMLPVNTPFRLPREARILKQVHGRRELAVMVLALQAEARKLAR